MRRNFLVLSVFLLMIFSSCNKKETIVLKEDDPLSLTPGVEWALVSEPYAAFRESPEFESTISSHARRGDILMVQGKQLCHDAETSRTYTWYLFEEGWLESSSVTIYDNKLKADSAAKNLF